jgi:hypothetical protein
VLALYGLFTAEHEDILHRLRFVEPQRLKARALLPFAAVRPLHMRALLLE